MHEAGRILENATLGLSGRGMSVPGRHPDWLGPSWDAPGVGALMTTRAGGASATPFHSMNLSQRVGDDPAGVARNRARFAKAMAATPVFLQQVHGCKLLRLERSIADGSSANRQADASVTTVAGLACTVLVADCLPVLFAAPQGRAVGAAHAGWRGLAAGVLEATLAEVCEAGQCGSAQVQCWLGACIGPRRFEVGRDVLQAFGGSADGDAMPGFVARSHGKWLADLPWLARSRLEAAGVSAIHGGQ
ncbi:MAG: polyphenol oxidase family protein, partial [Burkholderiaceae bacterium]